MATRPKVELHAAFFWTCDDCGFDNFVRSVPVPRERIIRDGMTEELEDFLVSCDGDFYTEPDHVTCQYCSSGYDVERYEV